MEYLIACLGSALQILFAYLFLSSFFEIKCDRENIPWFLAVGWLLNAVYEMLGIGGFYYYLAYLLLCVLMLLCIFGESGGQAVCLLVFAVVIPVGMNMAAAQLAASRSGIARILLLLTGEVLPLLAVLPVRLWKPMRFVRHSDEPDQDTLLLRQHMEMQQESMRALEQNYRQQRKNTHEFEHHLQVLRDLLDRGETERAREYLHRLKKNRAIHLMSVYSHHPVIDVILNQKYQVAQENEIKMQIRVNDLSSVDIPADYLVVVLTNLLDNAIEACRRIDGYREIRCSVLYDDGLYISIRNTSELVQVVDGKIPTSKQDSLSHGFGLMSVGYVLDKLGAEYTFGYEDGWFNFAAEIE